jgi:hypothetical protein
VPILFNYRACVTAVIPLQTVAKPAVTSTKPSLTYKSSRRRLNRREEKEKRENRGGKQKGEGTERRKTRQRGREREQGE